MQKSADLVDIEKCWKMSLLSLSEASIHPRKGSPKFDQPTPLLQPTPVPPLPPVKYTVIQALAFALENASAIKEAGHLESLDKDVLVTSQDHLALFDNICHHLTFALSL